MDKMKQTLVNWILLILVVLLAVSTVRSWFRLTQRGQIIGDLQNKLQTEKVKRDGLSRQLALVQSPEYIENEARNKLNMGREGETVLFLPPLVSPTPTMNPAEENQNWEKWVKVFF